MNFSASLHWCVHGSMALHGVSACDWELDDRSDCVCAGFTELLRTERQLDFRHANSVAVANAGLDIYSQGVYAAFPDGFR